MVTTQTTQKLQLPLDLNSKEFVNNKYEYYKWMQEEAPVFHGKLSFLDTYILSRYDDCVSFLKDPRFVRNRTTATGGSRIPFPMPKSVQLMAQSMITEDEPDHRRLRDLVHQAFTRHSLEKMSARIDALTHDLLDKAERIGTVDLKAAYALPIPVKVIQEMMGVDDEDMPKFKDGLTALKDGFSGWTVVRTFFWDMPRLSTFVRKLIERKRLNPKDDILTKLIQAEEEGEKLNEDELVSMVFLMIVAGYETTVQLITNGVLTLLQHPEQLEKLKAQPELIESAVEEILRYFGPVQSTKPAYALEDVTLHGVTIPKGAAVMPFLGAANHDPAVFENPDVFDIERFPNKHLGFGSGIHACLGAPLARMETKIALTNLLKRSPNLCLAVDPSELELQVRPGWHTYKKLPITLG
ncbi:cytochrome P450 [cf. Phormidesmis sp. LEGE 11477]|uniref:cytochrome P450 family protein n=1 Tax=cf. Phormidesmis sp. LEGE 11477 TaxID=1828680 RepID=UPI00187E4E5A|nr:cytochrome P450 [cf. Phormidesmis sp. LEGE 11477]MBE9063419.1 cytochrome P450 [cf. Phormidesmis sp. LEGE 11477]